MRDRVPQLRGGANFTNILAKRHFVSNLTLSSSFDNAAWIKGATTVSANTAVGPFNATEADSLVEDGTATTHYMYRPVTGTKYSVWAHAGTAASRQFCALGDDTGSHWSFFNLTTGAMGTQVGLTSRQIWYYGNGWWRLAVESSGFDGNMTVFMASADNVANYAGDGVSNILLWGADAR